MSRRIPSIDEQVWGDIANNFLTQSLNESYGHINLWNNSTRLSSSSLSFEHYGKIGWNMEEGCWELWEGSGWRKLYAKLENFDEIELLVLETILNNTQTPVWFQPAFDEAFNTAFEETRASELWGLYSRTEGVLSPNSELVQSINLSGIGVRVDSPTVGYHPVTLDYLDIALIDLTNSLQSEIENGSFWRLYGTQLKPTNGIVSFSNITVFADTPVNNLEVANKQYVDNKFNSFEYDLNQLKDLLGGWIEGLIESAIDNIPTPSPSPTPTPSPTPSPTPTPSPITGSLTIEQVSNSIEARSVASGVYIASANMRLNGSLTSSSQPVRFVLSNYYSPAGSWVSNSGISTALSITAQGSFSLTARVDIAARTSARSPGEGKYLYMLKGSDTSVFNFSSSTAWNNFMQNYYLDHVEIPYGGLRTTEWNTFLSNTSSDIRDYLS